MLIIRFIIVIDAVIKIYRSTRCHGLNYQMDVSPSIKGNFPSITQMSQLFSMNMSIYLKGTYFREN